MIFHHKASTGTLTILDQYRTGQRDYQVLKGPRLEQLLKTGEVGGA
jgi:hypothetical protein